MTGITNDWSMSMIEDNLATPRDPTSVREWRESSKHGQEEKSRNVIKVQLAQDKSHFEHRSSNISNPGENVACAQPSVAQEEDEIQIQILTMSQVNTQVKIMKRMIENQQQKGLNKSQKMSLRVGLRKSRKRHPHQSSGETRRTTKHYSESVFLFEKTEMKTMM